MVVSGQVRNVVAGLRDIGFTVETAESGAFRARRPGIDEGLVRVLRLVNPQALWLTFAEWPERRGTLAELRRWIETDLARTVHLRPGHLLARDPGASW